MNVYLDASVVLRKLQRETAGLPSWGKWSRAYSSELLRVEVCRTVDRNRVRGTLTDANVADLMQKAHAVFDAVELVPLSAPVLSRAAESFPTSLGALDALHLATALRLAELNDLEMTFLTHDAELALAARSLNFVVEGV